MSLTGKRRQHRQFPGERGPRPDRANARREGAIARMRDAALVDFSGDDNRRQRRERDIENTAKRMTGGRQ